MFLWKEDCVSLPTDSCGMTIVVVFTDQRQKISPRQLAN
jgi:hypothetical protein